MYKSHDAHAFDLAADEYDQQCMMGLKFSGESREYFARGRIEFLRRWWSKEGRPEPGRILDFGCGLGDGAALLAEAFPAAHITGVDTSQRCVELARSRHGSSRLEFCGVEEGVGAGAADLIHLNGVVHHIPPSERPPVFDRLHEQLSEAGVLAVFENNPLNPGTRLVMARIPFDRDASPVLAHSLRRSLETAGLSALETAYLFYFPRFLRALRWMEPSLLRVPLGGQYVVLARKRDRRTTDPS